ncbi:MAG: DUF2752 domain-containing protein [Chloroflexi bacterium]|uniref:DUF2752 domain-containing protein n=1 Tax=Candidatus Chlorohelix allophototropha TaxID=3003348 RepID=A0A8T7M1V1_9CHLR|nr:DUF2752 domain-containing protein [Chloroflexota bacterium]WJW65489.1 DUF2752 domain-containing protein [Chloroflexota bacterium L227-S17]
MQFSFFQKLERLVKKEKLKLATVAGVASVALPVLYFADPASAHFYPRCPFHLLTGLYCPACGSTRAAYHLLHGNFKSAIKLNALFVLGAPVLVLPAYRYLQQSLEKGRLEPDFKLDSRWQKAIIAIAFGFAFLRNLPFAPFTRLSPRS